MRIYVYTFVVAQTADGPKTITLISTQEVGYSVGTPAIYDTIITDDESVETGPYCPVLFIPFSF